MSNPRSVRSLVGWRQLTALAVVCCITIGVYAEIELQQDSATSLSQNKASIDLADQPAPKVLLVGGPQVAHKAQGWTLTTHSSHSERVASVQAGQRTVQGGASTESCCGAHNSPGCSDLDCETCVCGCDPFCCDTAWSVECASTGGGKGTTCGASNADGLCAAQCSECFCALTCPAGAIQEGEVDCFDQSTDSFNDGCNSDPPNFSPIACGQTVCGASGNFFGEAAANLRDTDHYQFTLTQQQEVTLCVTPEFPAAIELVTLPASGCKDAFSHKAVDVPGCLETCITTVLEPGTHWMAVTTSDFFQIPCGSNYIAELTCGPVMRACCVNGVCTGDMTQQQCAGGPPCVGDLAPAAGNCTVNASDLAILLGAWGPNPGHPADLNGSGTVNASDLALLLGNWGPCDPPCPTAGGNWNPDASCGANPNLPPPLCSQSVCGYNNGAPDDSFDFVDSQYNPVAGPVIPEFSAEAADDFVLKDDGANACLITGVRFWATHYGSGDPPVVVNPAADWNGVQITVYDESSSTTKGPSGHRNDDGSFTGTVIYTEFFTMANVAVAPFAVVDLDEAWQVDVPATIILQKNHKYWFVAQPEMDFQQFGQVALLKSLNSTGHNAQRIFNFVGISAWQEVGENIDIAFELLGEKISPDAVVACCNETTGMCVSNTPLDQCFDPGERFTFGVTQCANLVPPCTAETGACCTNGATQCVEITLAQCNGLNGTFQGVDVSCGPEACVPPVCGDPNAGQCYADNSGNPVAGCNIAECCDAVCKLDSFCCQDTWDGTCAAESQDFPQCPNTPCPLTCPGGAAQEGEPCGTDANGGCVSLQDEFGTATCGSVICGTSWADGGARDFDQYKITVPDTGGDGFEKVTLSLNSQFEGVALLLGYGVPTDCMNASVFGDRACSNACIPIQDGVAIVPAPGEYVVQVWPDVCDNSADVLEGFPCIAENADYRLQIACTDVICGDAVCDAPAETCANCPADGCDPGPCAPACGNTHLTHSTTENVEPGNSAACVGGGFTSDNCYCRTFPGPLPGGAGPTFSVCSVEFGKETAVAGGGAGSQPGEIRFWNAGITGDAPAFSFIAPNLVVPFMITDGDLTIQTVTIAPDFTTTTDEITVCVCVPNGVPAMHTFFIGSNNDGQSSPSYLQSTGCGLANPTPTGNIGFPDMHIVMTVNGCADSATCP